MAQSVDLRVEVRELRITLRKKPVNDIDGFSLVFLIAANFMASVRILGGIFKF